MSMLLEENFVIFCYTSEVFGSINRNLLKLGLDMAAGDEDLGGMANTRYFDTYYKIAREGDKRIKEYVSKQIKL